MSSREELQRLVELARDDPGFFHALVFDPERILPRVDFLPRKLKAALLAKDPISVIDDLVSAGGPEECGTTCGPASCEETCGTKSCGETCLSSCNSPTCANSCGGTDLAPPSKPSKP